VAKPEGTPEGLELTGQEPSVIGIKVGEGVHTMVSGTDNLFEAQKIAMVNLRVINERIEAQFGRSELFLPARFAGRQG
jgi:hypothetical protein